MDISKLERLADLLTQLSLVADDAVTQDAELEAAAALREAEALLQECRDASDDTHIHAAIDAFLLDSRVRNDAPRR